MKRIRIDSSHTINRRGHLIKRCNEHYLRNDIQCSIPSCSKCEFGQNPTKYQLDPNNHNLFIIASPDILKHYLDILDNLKQINFVFLTSTIDEFKKGNSTRRLSQLKSFLAAANRFTAVLDDRFSEEIYSVAQKKAKTEPDGLADFASASADWYRKHTESFKVHILSDTQIVSNQSVEPPLKLTFEAFCKNENDVLSNALKRSELCASAPTNENDAVLKAKLGEIAQSFDLISEGLLLEEAKRFEGTYDAFWPESELSDAVRKGELTCGKVHFDRNNWQEAYVNCQVDEKTYEKVWVVGRTNLNRVVHGDRVAVKVLPKAQWQPPASAADRSDGANAEIQPSGKVVGVLRRNWRTYVATLEVDDDKDKLRSGGAAVLCVPFDPRVTKIRVNTRSSARLANRRVKVVIDSWPEDSIYPNGHLSGDFGPAGDLETETKVILHENGLQNAPFGKSLLNCLPPDWAIPKEEITKRVDLRDSRLVFSVDPIGCEDIDDALSVFRLGKGVFEIGVHIADVTYFVAEDSLVDREAKSRGTTIYLKDRRIDMIPKRLSANECSLHEGKDRLTLSVFWEVDFNENSNTHQPRIRRHWFKRTVNRSNFALNYVEANLMLQNDNLKKFENKAVQILNQSKGNLLLKDSIDEAIEPNNSFENLRTVLKMDPSQYKNVRRALLRLNDFSISLRTRREQKGAVSFNSGWELDSAQGRGGSDPEKIGELVELFSLSEDSTSSGQLMNTHNTIEELMVQANRTVAAAISKAVPEGALLRRHQSPLDSSAEEMNKQIKALGVGALDFGSNASLAKSMQLADATSSGASELIKVFLRSVMCEAEYFSTGDDKIPNDSRGHFGLAVEKYTHFTSPIRRYSDIIVHRTLINTMRNLVQTNKNESSLPLLCEHLNLKNRSARNAQRMSNEYSRVCKLKDCLFYTNAQVIGVRRNSLLVYIPSFLEESEDAFGEDDEGSYFRGVLVLRNKDGKFFSPFPEVRPQKGEEVDKAGFDCEVEQSDEKRIRLIVKDLKIDKSFAPLEKIPVQIGLDQNSKNIYRFPQVRIRYAFDKKMEDIPPKGVKVNLGETKEVMEGVEKIENSRKSK